MHTPNIIHFLAQLHHHHLYPIQNQISQNVCFQLVWGVCVSVCVCVLGCTLLGYTYCACPASSLEKESGVSNRHLSDLMDGGAYTSEAKS